MIPEEKGFHGTALVELDAVPELMGLLKKVICVPKQQGELMQKLMLEIELDFDKIIHDEMEKVKFRGDFGGFSRLEWRCIAKMVKEREDKLRTEIMKDIKGTFKWSAEVGQYVTDDDAFTELQIRIFDLESIPKIEENGEGNDE